eukprot:NP_508338.2 Uncharacterized protein CELE_T26C11.3 [Caenorhabditis elegans]
MKGGGGGGLVLFSSYWTDLCKTKWKSTLQDRIYRKSFRGIGAPGAALLIISTSQHQCTVPPSNYEPSELSKSLLEIANFY